MIKEVSLPEKWDHECDVLVIGGGNAGFPAAIEAAKAGAETVVLEQTKKCFGSLAVFFGKHVNFAGSKFQKDQGVEDSPDKYYEDAMKYSNGDPELWKAYVSNHLKGYDFLTEIGARPTELWRLPGHSVPRSLFYEGGGPKILSLLEAAAKRQGVEIMYNHKALRLFVDLEKERVVGVAVQKDGKTLNYGARKAVVIASGGFGNNPEMVEEFRGFTYADKCICMMRGHTGEGIKMAMSIGAATRNIGTAAIASIPVDANTKKLESLLVNHLLCGGIMVNEQGKRFINESTPKLGGAPKSPYIGESSFRQPGDFLYVLYDSNIKERIQMVDWSLYQEYQADTIEALAEQIGIDPESLCATVNKYNEDVDTHGYDTVFNRKALEVPPDAPVLKIEKGPFYAIKGMSSLTSFKGGLKINDKAQVVDLYGTTVSGLYAAGETTGGWFREGCYIDGTMTSMSLTMGLIAGKNAAAEKP
jgi:flavocytochrome c